MLGRSGYCLPLATIRHLECLSGSGEFASGEHHALPSQEMPYENEAPTVLVDLVLEDLLLDSMAIFWSNKVAC